MSVSSSAAEQIAARRRPGWGARLLQRPAAVVGLVIFVVLAGMVLAAPWLTDLDPLKVSPSAALTPPSIDALMGRDNLGRDVWTRFLYGGRISLSVGLSAALLGAVVGVICGALAGYYGGLLDAFFSWVAEVLLAFPGILLAMVVVSVLGTGVGNTIIAVGIALIPSFLRMARGSVLSARQEVYVEAAQVVGATNRRILFRHILPNISRPLLALLTLGVGGAILEGAALSFLGLGAQPPSPEWGAMLNAGQSFMRVGWWIGLFPGLGIFLIVLSVNLIGDGLSDLQR
ncbi:MAG: ABC transporter permease [Caldilineaceae bacterium]|nr:ABC transporter permease [Caldilineaceae bacterium]